MKSEPAYAGPLDAGVVRTPMGVMRGMVAADYRLFQAIPYAAPPVGPLRWQPPRPAAKWSGMLDATKPGPQCMQDTGSDQHAGKATGENCLTLNVWTPAPARGTGKRPVMVWIHGGGFVNGSGDIYNSRGLAAKGHIVVVTINYRLGALGFLAHPSLGPGGNIGNYGLADQQAALRWVRDHIADFGGDPRKVTVAGESAGGMSVCDHLVAPGSAGLFRAAIIQSAPCQAQADVATGARESVDYAASVGCRNPVSTAACLRALPATALDRPPWYVSLGDSDALSGPLTGTALLPDAPVPASAAGRAARVPVLIGVNHDEFTMFAALRYLKLGRGITAGEYPRLLADIFGADGAAVLAHYSLDHYGGDASLAYSAALTDGLFSCVADRLADSLSQRGATAPVYAYEFDDPHAPAPNPFHLVHFPVGASHSLELRYLFKVGGAPLLNPAQRMLSDQMVSYWSHFVTNGTPTATGQPAWPAKTGDAGENVWMSLRPGSTRVITNFEEAHQCPFWASLKGRS
ncbi:carboxylesterase/lipase family protein [Candidatus Mycobacterium methanotrophicum]|uniref:Carboxylic ester hydrolase n=1 Tax=Candidatus Mycobacterium methanotrophicum TaxID=2943498 RepID=A0ABY4QKM8_9MYCO|nr:carboxylesterase family protein [Candidatus Mycobacterium methanotrophicum]UQX11592.1 carboxylesterase family protein [Candidatus Mycobacterium methanotrophicum]